MHPGVVAMTTVWADRPSILIEQTSITLVNYPLILEYSSADPALSLLRV